MLVFLSANTGRTAMAKARRADCGRGSGAPADEAAVANSQSGHRTASVFFTLIQSVFFTLICRDRGHWDVKARDVVRHAAERVFLTTGPYLVSA